LRENSSFLVIAGRRDGVPGALDADAMRARGRRRLPMNVYECLRM
jgi:hypothetical protein